jgi:hypothetical protein
MVAMAMPKLPKKMAMYHLCFSCYVWQQEEMEEYEPHRDLGIHLNTQLSSESEHDRKLSFIFAKCGS